MQSATLRRIGYVSVIRPTHLKFCRSQVLSHPRVCGRDPDSPLGGAAAIPMAPLSLHCSQRMSFNEIKNAFTQNTATHRAIEQWLVSKKRWGSCQMNNLKTWLKGTRCQCGSCLEACMEDTPSLVHVTADYFSKSTNAWRPLIKIDIKLV